MINLAVAKNIDLRLYSGLVFHGRDWFNCNDFHHRPNLYYMHKTFLKAAQISTSSCTVIRWNKRLFRKEENVSVRSKTSLCWNTLSFFVEASAEAQLKVLLCYVLNISSCDLNKQMWEKENQKRRLSRVIFFLYSLYAAEWKKSNELQLTWFLFSYGSYFRGPWFDNKEQRREDKAKSYSAIHDFCKATRKMLFRKYQGIYI